MSAESTLHAPPHSGFFGRKPGEWLIGLPTIALLLLVLVIGTGEMLHGQLLRMGESMFGNAETGVQYFMLRADPEKPACDTNLNIDAEVARQMQAANAGAGSGDDVLDDLFAPTAIASLVPRACRSCCCATSPAKISPTP